MHAPVCTIKIFQVPLHPNKIPSYTSTLLYFISRTETRDGETAQSCPPDLTQHAHTHLLPIVNTGDDGEKMIYPRTRQPVPYVYIQIYIYMYIYVFIYFTLWYLYKYTVLRAGDAGDDGEETTHPVTGQPCVYIYTHIYIHVYVSNHLFCYIYIFICIST